MKIISANWVVTCDENNSIIKNGAVVFDDKIIEIDTLLNIEIQRLLFSIINYFLVNNIFQKPHKKTIFAFKLKKDLALT